jgi:prepilin-type processing-associated H-X9-DG protein
LSNLNNPSEKLMVVEGFNGTWENGGVYWPGAGRDNAEDPWYVVWDNYCGDGTGSSLLAIRHDGDANVAFVDGHVEKGKDKFDAEVGTVLKFKYLYLKRVKLQLEYILHGL